jgi:hypothetical protein
MQPISPALNPNYIFVVRVKNILKDNLDVNMVIQSAQAGFFLEGDYLRVVDKNEYLEELIKLAK